MGCCCHGEEETYVDPQPFSAIVVHLFGVVHERCSGKVADQQCQANRYSAHGALSSQIHIQAHIQLGPPRLVKANESGDAYGGCKDHIVCCGEVFQATSVEAVVAVENGRSGNSGSCA